RADLAKHPAGSTLQLHRDNYRAYLNECSSQLKKQRGLDLPIHFDFVDSPEINAAACKADNVYLIGINIGTCDRLARLYQSLLSWPEIFPQVGDCSGEVAADLDLARCLHAPLNSSGPRNRPGASSFLMPKDRRRLLFAICLDMMALDFIFAHELSHILAGHLDF